MGRQVFKPSIMQRAAAVAMVASAALGAIVLLVLDVFVSLPIGKGALLLLLGAPALYSVLRGFWFRVVVDEDTVKIRNLNTVVIPKQDITRVATSHPIARSKAPIWDAPLNQVRLEVSGRDDENVFLMWRDPFSFDWSDRKYEERLQSMAAAIGCPLEAPEHFVDEF